MRWWGVKTTPKQQQQDQAHEESKSGKGKAAFSLLTWFSKLTAKHNAAAASSKPKKHAAPEAKISGGGCGSFHEGTTPSPASRSSPADTLSPAASDIVPRRLSVGNDGAEAEATAAVARQLSRRRHYSVGGDRDLPPLSHLSAFSRAASPPQFVLATAPTPVLTLPSDTDEEKRPRNHQRRRRGGGRRSFSGRTTPGARLAAVRVRSPRCSVAAVSGLERFAVVRRTSDPQREFRNSMVEMITSKRIGRPEELETLLACYLALNAEEHHDCIVKVFRQVWFELNPARIATVTSRPRS
ncbi:transcription repressor OFP1-like [Triticum urartu]|uniref:Transcription repressor n=1 Tax=Triticum urartu TaxID=4572 RepID=A0A8R7TX53_TRIUA|nr:transcription repressor OFP1-like [Triticum urartu]